MKTKPVLPLVLTMALPMTISMLVNSLYNIVDSYFVAKINEEAMTALSMVYPMQNLVNAVTVGSGIGINAVVAFYLGAGKEKEADRATTLGMLCNVILGVLLTAFCMGVMPVFLRLFTTRAEVITLGLEYSDIVFLFCIPIAVAIGFEKLFQAVGRMQVSMVCMILGCVVNIILDPLLIFGWGWIPAMGIRGAAIATSLGQLVTLAGYLTVYFRHPLAVKISLSELRWDGNLLSRIYAVGIPAMLNLALPSLQVSVLNGILSVYEEGYVLVLGAYFKLQTFLYLTANGVIQGMRPLLSFNYGAGEKQRVRSIFATAFRLILGVMIIGMVLCLVIPESLIGLFTGNRETVLLGGRALRTISLGFVISSLTVTVSGAMEALGQGTKSLVLSMMRYVLVILPAAFLLSRTMGPQGVWHGFWITEFVTAAVAGLLYRKLMLDKY